MQLLIECTTEQQDLLIHDFCQFVYRQLEITNPPALSFVEHTGSTSFGSYQPSTEDIIVATEGRHISDILRTLGHELVHHKQLSEGENNMSLEQLEYEANAIAGMLMRDYNKLHPEMFGLTQATTEPSDRLGDSQGSTFPDVTRPSGPINMAEDMLSELSNQTLASYKRKARRSAEFIPSYTFRHRWKNTIPGNRKTMSRHLEKIPDNLLSKRKEGIIRAEKKLRQRYNPVQEEMGVGGGAVAGIGIGPQGEPGVQPRKKKSPILQPLLRRKTFKQMREEVTPEEARKKLLQKTHTRSTESENARKELLKRIETKK